MIPWEVQVMIRSIACRGIRRWKADVFCFLQTGYFFHTMLRNSNSMLGICITLLCMSDRPLVSKMATCTCRSRLMLIKDALADACKSFDHVLSSIPSPSMEFVW